MKQLRLIALLMALLFLTTGLTSCLNGLLPNRDVTTQADTSEIGSDEAASTGQTEPKFLNGVALEAYTIVYSLDDVDYSKRAATYIQEQITMLTNIELEVKKDTEGTFAHEIVVGETSREISDTLNADMDDLQFAILADDAHIAMEGDYFVIAAAAYFFIETYIMANTTDVQIPKEVRVHDPIVKEAKNFILLIGDGMGVNQTRLFETFDVATEGNLAYSDGEDIFYGYMLPYQGLARTTSLSGTTDSAAGGTALATGYKTYNSRVGRDKDYKDIQSLTELAGSLGKSTAVMSTDSATGATPAAFSAHADNRSDSDVIRESQDALKKKYGTSIYCGFSDYDQTGINTLEYRLRKTLTKLATNENGFFIMYEEAHIDKHSHNSEMEKTFNALVRFNQAIGVFMEFVFYHPETALVITADHETGGLQINNDGEFYYTSAQNSEGTRNHTGAAVPVFAYGADMESFHDQEVENVEIPKLFAKLWGVEDFGGPIHAYDYFL